ncbi:hypothetical protein D3C80_1479580 [compost metagenome]
MGLILLLAIESGVGAPEPGGDAPVDVAHLIPRLIGAQLAKAQAGYPPEPALFGLMNAGPGALTGPQPDGQQLAQRQGYVGMAAGIQGHQTQPRRRVVGASRSSGTVVT